MLIADFVVGAVIISIVALAVYVLYRESKNGAHCKGCGSCNRHNIINIEEERKE